MKTPVQEYFEEIDKTYYDYKTLQEQQELLNDAKQKEKRTEIEKKYLDGMIDAFNRSIFHIEINYSN